MRGLDALRGVAVMMVVVFHAWPGALPGGLVGVSLFFTLSGYLITTLLLGEVIAGRVDLGRFWTRRARRLLPAAVTVAALVVAVAELTHLYAPHRTAADGLAALLDVANWRFLLAGRSYSALFTAPSPLLHYWSLAVEEQYYLVFPLVAWWCARRRHPRVVLTIVLASVVGVSLHAAAAGWGHDRMYYGSDVRAGEIAIGALLAIAVSSGRVPTSRRPWLCRIARSLQLPALVVGGWAAATATERSAWLYHGGFEGLALCWAVLVLGGALDIGVMRLLGRLDGLVWLGTISYGLYLVHWPLVTAFHATGDHPVAAVLATGLAVLVAAVSHRWPERAFRRIVLTRRQAEAWLGTVVVTIAAVAATAAVTVGATPGWASVPKPLALTTATLKASPAPTRPGPVQMVSSGGAPLRVMVIGDSTGRNLGLALQRSAEARSGDLIVDPVGMPGCALADAAAQSMVHPDSWATVSSSCRNWAVRLQPVMALFRPDVVVAVFGPTQTSDLILPGSHHPVSILDQAVVEASRSQMAALETLTPNATWVWASAPRTFAAGAGIPEGDWVINDPVRTAAWNATLTAFANQQGNAALDLAGWIEASPRGWHDRSVRPDGMHLADQPMASVAQRTVAFLQTLRSLRR